jgi:hypothetical protein
MNTIVKFSNILSNRKLATIALAGFMASFRAGAALETETLPTVTYPLTQTDYSTGLEVAQFDSALGQLQSVTITATGTASFTQFYQNLSTSSANLFKISQNLDLLLSLPASGPASIVNLNLSSGTQTYYTPKYTGTPYLSGPSGGTVNYSAAASDSAVLSSSSAAFSQFSGSGSVDFLLIANGSSTITETNGNYFAGGQSLAGLNLTVTYDYTSPVVAAPEPLTWTWMAGVFAMSGLFIGMGKRQPKSL